MLTFTVTGATGATLTDSCSRLIEELPTDSQIMHCPYVGDDIVVSCTSDVDSSTIRHEHNGVVATDGTFEYTDAKITDRDVIAGLYTCRAQLEDDCFTEVQGYAQLYGKEEVVSVSLYSPCMCSCRYCIVVIACTGKMMQCVRVCVMQFCKCEV